MCFSTSAAIDDGAPSLGPSVMSATPTDSSFRMPTCPYPGLRPFLDHEASLLQGRTAQVDEVIRRLGETRFVAVVGGSGSGKSSLIRAGVVPRLRALALSEVGQYWVPIVFTPGTTVSQSGAQQSGAPTAGSSMKSTPITRLAWKVDKALRTDSDTASEVRRANIVSLMRLGSGFSRIVDAYTEDLPDEGADRSDARFLFVIDQFEEVFDFSNRKLPDAMHLVEALISHFTSPDPRVFIVITMRSERLAECAAYLELPEAINRSMYLLRRLNDVELRDAIVGPAKSYLRLCQRARAQGLPRDIEVEQEVVDELLADVSRIADDPDHLPLLQHMLARTWQVALERERRGPDSVPATLTLADLDSAAAPPGLEPPRSGLIRLARGDPEFNRLRASLDHWAQLEYEQPLPGQKRSEADRDALDSVLRRIGYRDPNNGLYFQDRLAVDDERLMGGVPDRAARLRMLLKRGFLDEVNYLHWDDEDERHQTVKVSHEAFIRGWQHFRRMVDEDAERFEEFLLLLRRCAAWDDKGRPDDAQLLLEPAELVRIDARQLPEVLADPRERAEWFRVVEISRDGKRLSQAEASVESFLDRSRALRNAEERAHHDAELSAERNRLGLLVVGGIAVVALTVTVVLWPVVSSVEGFSGARAQIERLGSDPGEGATLRQLGTLVHAGRGARDARHGVDFWYPWSRSPYVSWIPLIGTVGRLPDMTTSEPLVNGRLRQLLTSAIWPSGVRLEDVSPSHFTGGAHTAIRRDGVKCSTASDGATPVSPQPEGTLFIETLDSNRIGERALFIPTGSMSDEREAELALYAARARFVDGKLQDCLLGTKATSFPVRLMPRLLLDARLNYAAAAFSDAVTFYDLSWRTIHPDKPQEAGTRQRWVSTEAVARRTFDDEFGVVNPGGKPIEKSRLVRAVATWREPGGYGFWAGGHGWRALESGFQPVPDGASTVWQPLRHDGASHCLRLTDAIEFAAQPKYNSKVYVMGSRCVEVKRGQAPGYAVGTEQIFVNLYDALNMSVVARLGNNLPAPVASVEAYRGRPAALAQNEEWVVGAAAPYVGWIGVRRMVAGKAAIEAAPLTTEALLALAEKFCDLRIKAEKDFPPKVLPPEAERCRPTRRESAGRP